MKRKVRKSDLMLLLQIFIPGKYNLFIEDPNEVLVYDNDESSNRYHVSSDAKYSVYVKMGSSENSLQDYDFVIDFSDDYKSPHINLKTFYYINNPDKTMRWIFPAALRKPTFLNFYNSSGIKAKLLAFLLKIAYRFNLGMYFNSGTFTIRQNIALKVESFFKDIPHESYSIFTGTIGPNRKALIELNTDGISTHFAKIAISDASKKLILAEIAAVKRINALHLKNFVVPSIAQISDTRFVIYNSIKPDHVVDNPSIGDVHLCALAELYEKTSQCQYSDMNGLRQQLIKRISELEPDNRIGDSMRIISMLREVSEKMSMDIVPFTTAHFDFTPWNMYCDGSKIYVYDWELSQRKAPVLYDVFHYIFQKGILIDHSDLNTIKCQIRKALQHEVMQDIINRYHVNVELCYEAYLLDTISYYLHLYSQQKNLHQQVFWLVAVWQKALEEIHAQKNQISQRNNFIQNLILHLEQFDYALMKFSELKLSELAESSDLDILVKKDNLEEIFQYIVGSSATRKVRVIRKSFMVTVALFFEDGSFLSIDLLLSFKRKSIQMLSSRKILDHTFLTAERIKVPQRHHDFEYIILFYQLNYSDVPDKYRIFFEALSNNEKDAICDYMKHIYALEVSSKDDLFYFNRTVQMNIQKILAGRNDNKGWNKLRSVFNYIIDACLETIYNKGVVVTVSGVDGAGKSTIIEDLKQLFLNKFRRKVIVLRHRPSILPILSSWKYGKKQAEKLAAERLPRKGNNKSSVSSFIRFAYYYTDYFFGQIYIYLRYVLRGYTVIYDRYYFDFIGDSKRSNIEFNKNFITWLYAFIYKPQLNVLLYAPAKEIRLRKQELEEDDIIQLTNDYLSLFDRLASEDHHSRYLSIENTDRNKTLDQIVKEYIKVF